MIKSNFMRSLILAQGLVAEPSHFQMPENADNAKEEDVGSGSFSDSENGMDKILHDLIKAQERLHEQD
jgi:hypothetical protein